MDKKYNVALSSFGMSGRVFHGPLLKVHEGFEVTKVLERTKDLSSELFPRARRVRTYEEILNDPGIDLVVVNTPDHLHYKMARQALEAGKHVVVEKPFTVRTEEADELIRLAGEKGKVLTVFQNRRWDGDFMTVRKILKESWLGRLVEMESHFDRYRRYPRPGVWKDQDTVSTGSVYNLGSHLIDQALVLFGMPEALFADLRVVRENTQVNDYFNILLYYPGLRVILKHTYLAMQPGPRFTLLGDEGAYVKQGVDPQEERLTGGILPLAPGWGAEDKEKWGYLLSDGELSYHGKYETVPGDYLAFYDNLWQVLNGEAALAVKPGEARNVIHLIELAIKSSEEKKVIEVK